VRKGNRKVSDEEENSSRTKGRKARKGSSLTLALLAGHVAEESRAGEGLNQLEK